MRVAATKPHPTVNAQVSQATVCVFSVRPLCVCSLSGHCVCVLCPMLCALRVAYAVSKDAATMQVDNHICQSEANDPSFR